MNRVARPFYLEAMRIVGDGGASVEQVDAAMSAAGFRMGPFELIDTIGADVNLAVSRGMHEAFWFDPRYQPHPMRRASSSTPGALAARRAVASTTTRPMARGEPHGPGLRRDSAAPRERQLNDEQISTLVMAALVNEAASAVADSVAAADAIDTAMRLGANYPSGPLEWGERTGLDRVVQTLDALHTGGSTGATESYRCCAPWPRAVAPSSPCRRERGDAASVSGRRLRHGRPAAGHRDPLAPCRDRALPATRWRVRWDDKMAVIGTSFEHTADVLRRAPGRAAGARR